MNEWRDTVPFNVRYWYLADMPFCFWGVKRTWRFALQVSANDPKRTLSMAVLAGLGGLFVKWW
jgi:hypothetical protein